MNAYEVLLAAGAATVAITTVGAAAWWVLKPRVEELIRNTTAAAEGVKTPAGTKGTAGDALARIEGDVRRLHGAVEEVRTEVRQQRTPQLEVVELKATVRPVWGVTTTEDEQ